MTRNKRVSVTRSNEVEECNTRAVESRELNDLGTCDGSDSGVETNNGRYDQRRLDRPEGDFETDTGVCHIENYVYSSATKSGLADMPNDCASIATRLQQQCLGDKEILGEHLTCYDAASENGSESSSLDDGRKFKLKNSLGSNKFNSSACRQATTISRPPHLSLFPRDSFKFVSEGSAICKRSLPASTNAETNKSKVPVSVLSTSRVMRSCSNTKSRTITSSDAEVVPKWLMETRVRGSGPTAGLIIDTNEKFNERVTTYDTYATLPRRKYRDGIERESRSGHRDPNLNRAASSRKTFLKNTLMTTSMNASMGSYSFSPSNTITKTTPPSYVKSKPTKTKIYLEMATQTLLTNSDVNATFHSNTFALYSETNTQTAEENVIKKCYAEQLMALNEELKKVKRENEKQRTVIEWLEDEFASSKEEKYKLRNEYNSVEQRIRSLLTHKDHADDVVNLLEQELFSQNNVILKQEKEILELQQLCGSLKQDVDQNQLIQKTIMDTQKTTEAESFELLEFLQAEKITLSDSLKDMEKEISFLNRREQELTKKLKAYEDSESICEKLRLEKRTLSAHLMMLERHCREVFLYQGAVISSASVALSGLESRFDQLLDQLFTTCNISVDDVLLRDDFVSGQQHNGNEVESKYVMNSSYETTYSSPWLQAIRDFIAKTSKVTDRNECIERKEWIADDERRASSIVNANTDIFLPKNDFDSRRNSTFSDYINDDNLDVSEQLNDICGADVIGKSLNFLKDCPGKDISLVEQISEIDKLVTKAFSALYISFNKSCLDDKTVTNEKDVLNSNAAVISLLNTDKHKHFVSDHGNVVACLQLQHKTVNNLLSVLNQMQDAVDSSSVLKKIQSDIKTLDEKCYSFFNNISFDTAV